MSFKPVTEFDRQKFEARLGSLKGPGHIVDRHWVYNNGFNSHNDGSQYAAQMIEEGIWKRCEKCGKVFNPIYGHTEEQCQQ